MNGRSSGNFTKGNLAKAGVTITMYAVSTAQIIITVVTYGLDADALSVASVNGETGIINGATSLALVQAVVYLPIVNVSSTPVSSSPLVADGHLPVHTLRCYRRMASLASLL